MSIGKVEELLGGRWGKHFSGNVMFHTEDVLYPAWFFSGDKLEATDLRILWPKRLNEKSHLYSETRAWIGDEYGIWITFSEDG